MKHPEPLLTATDISRQHPSGIGWLLDHISLAVQPGLTLGLMGPSGSGKTLLLRALAMLDPIETGEIRFRDKLIERQEIPQYRSRVIYMHQSPKLLADSVEEAFRRPFALHVHQRRKFHRERILEYLLAFGHDASFLEKPIRDLSGGETQFVALMRAIQLDPCILLLDEPTSALDADATRAMERLLCDWKDQALSSRSMVWVTHSQEQAERVSHQIIRLSHGKIKHGE